MRALVSIHRWLGVVFCLFFAMWFVTGIAMHFVPFPALTEAERTAGLGAIAPSSLVQASRAVADVYRLNEATRVRLFQRTDGPVFIAYGAGGNIAVHPDLSAARVQSPNLALAIAKDHARHRGIAADAASVSALDDYDQWTVPSGIDPHRPLFRVALNDEAATELYVSSTTGEVVQDTTRFERRLNYAGSILHWIYPTVLRRNWSVWDRGVWTLSLAALIAAVTGALLGVLRLQYKRKHIESPFRGWQAWHHWLGLSSMIFVLTWIFSGWLSMDHGRIFSSGKFSPAEMAIVTGQTALNDFSRVGQPLPARAVREIEWFAFDGRIYRRDRYDVDAQDLALTAGAATPRHSYLQLAEANALAKKLAATCLPAVALEANDDYPITPSMPGAPVYRLVCGDAWFNIDGASGAPLEKLDGSRRAYRWLYQGLHTLDFAALTTRPFLRTAAISGLCGLGMLFSVTAIVIGWRRLRRPTM